jgi:hypothetical protein
MKSYEYRLLSSKFTVFAKQLMPEMGVVGQVVLKGHVETLLWNIGCMLNAAKGPLNLDNIAPDFGLLLCKGAVWKPVMSDDIPPPISGEAQDAVRSLIGRIGELILPQGDKPGLQHVFTTDDGLICSFYRMDDREIILKAAGIDPMLVEPARVLH